MYSIPNTNSRGGEISVSIQGFTYLGFCFVVLIDYGKQLFGSEVFMTRPGRVVVMFSKLDSA